MTSRAPDSAADERERQLRFVMDHAPVLLAHCDAQRRYRFVNRPYAELLGVGQDQVVGRTIAEVLGDEAYGQIAAHVDAALDGRRVEFEVELPPAGRRPARVLLATYEPERDEHARVVGLVAALVDITARRQAEVELRRSATVLQAISDTTSDLIFVKDSQTRLVFANPATLSALGLSAAEVIGKTELERYSEPGEADEIMANDRRVMTHGVTETNEEVYTGPLGTRTYLSTKFPLRDESGAVTGVVAISRDITDRKRDEARLRETAERLEVAMNAAELGGWEWDLSSGTLECTARACALLGVPTERVSTLGQLATCVHADDVLAHRQALERGAETGRYEHEFRVVRPDGSCVWIAARGRVLLDADGRRARMVGVVFDVTARRRSDELLSGHRRILELIARGEPLVEVFLAVGRLVEEQRPGVRCAIVLPDRERRRIGRVVAPSLPVAFSSAMEGLPIGAPHVGSCGKAIDTGQSAAVADVEGDDEFAPEWRALLRAHGVRACQSLPVLAAGGEVVASLALLRRERESAELDDAPLAQVCAHLVGITIERERARRAVELSDGRLRLALAAARMVAWEYDPATEAVSASDNLAEVFGLAPGTTIEHSARGFALVHPDDVERHRAKVQRAIETGGPYASEFRVVRPSDGVTIWLEERARCVRSPAGDVQLVGVVTDVTERRRGEEERRFQRQQLDFVLQVTGVGAWLNELPLRALNWDAATRRLFFVAPGEAATAELFWSRLHPDDRDPTRTAVETALRDGTLYDIVHRAVDPGSGRVRWIRSSGKATYGLDGTPTRFDGINYDVTELKEAERQKDEFLSVLAHELRNPLAPLRNGLELLRGAGSDPARLERTRALMERQVGHLTRLVDDLLDLGRISRGKIELRLAPLPLQEVIQAALETSRPWLEQRRHRLAVALPDEPVLIDADLTRLAQAFANLLNNAAKYTPAGGRVDVTATVAGDAVTVTVADDGVGIPAPMLERVFDMFTQVEGSRAQAQGGLGIGLTLVRRLVELHGGQVEARSGGAGRGSEFVVRLPLAARPRSDERGAVASPEASAPRRRILVVDDNVDAADTLQLLLSELGHEARSAYDGVEGLEAAETFRPEMALLDLGMPRLDGLELARRIRARPWGSDVVLIALTGWGQDSDRRRAREAGFDHHLTKPLQLATLERLLSAPRGSGRRPG